MPKVSVIMATYNSADTLPRAIESILSQTLSDFEFIIVDDGSTDSSPKVLNDYSHKDKRIIVVTQKNQGLAIARNIGVARSSGKYVAFMDSDDACAINRLEIQYNFMELNKQHSACLVYPSAPISDYSAGIRSAMGSKHKVFCGSVFQNPQNFSVLGCSSFMTKESFTKIGGYRWQGTIIEDLDFTLRYAHHYSFVVLDNDNAYFYTSPVDNFVMGTQGLSNQDVFNFAKRILSSYLSEWCRANNIQDPVDEDKTQDEILARGKIIPHKDKVIIYSKMKYFASILAEINNISRRQAQYHLLGLLSANRFGAWSIIYRLKLAKILKISY